MRCAFEYEQVYAVRAEENDDEADDFGALFIGAFEVPDAVAEVAIKPSSNESDEIREFIVPVQDFMENPESRQSNQCVQYADGVIFDKVFHGGKNTIFAT